MRKDLLFKNFRKLSLNLRQVAIAGILTIFLVFQAKSQNNPLDELGNISGNFQSDVQKYKEDSLIGAPNYPSRVGTNSYVNLRYVRGKFSAGVRYEMYLPTLQGFTRQTGAGIGNRYIRYSGEKFDLTAGTFYEQFGSGMTLRTWEEWGLGFDNAIDGFRGKFMPVPGIEITGLIGKQRSAKSFNLDPDLLSQGFVRGANGEFSLMDIIKKWNDKKTRIKLGASFVSRFQSDDDPIYVLPENVATWSGRAQINRGRFFFQTEYVYKINDPSSVNNLIYKPGNGILIQTTWSKKGFGVSLSMKRIDNMDFRSDRSATFNNLTINYLPPLTKQHTYRLATLFPYATQPLGEVGFQAEIAYKIPKGTKLGGTYGTNITLNMSRVQGLETTPAADPDMGYESKLFGFGGDLYIQDINLDITRKISKNFKLGLTNYFFKYDHFLFHQLTGFDATENVKAWVSVVEGTIQVKPKHSLRIEAQHCLTPNEFGSWAMLLAEYSISPHWFFSAFDEYNYGNENPVKRIHYYSGQFGYLLNQFRITLGYGRQRAGVLCVGGVCRLVPASNGFQLSVSGTF